MRFNQMALHMCYNYIANAEIEVHKPLKGTISSEIAYWKRNITPQTNSIPPALVSETGLNQGQSTCCLKILQSLLFLNL